MDQNTYQANMETKSTFDLLLDYPEKHGLEYQTHEKTRRLLSAVDPTLATKFVQFNVKEDIWFYAYDSYAAKNFTSQTFSGLYSPINLHSKISLKAYKKDWFDFILRKNRKKTGNSEVDSKLTVTCDNNTFPAKLFSGKEARLFEQLENHVNPLMLLIEPDYLPTIKELKDQTIVGLEVSNWMYEEQQIDRFIDLGTQLLRGIKKNV